MPAPHTLPIVRFSKVTLRPVIWWGKAKEATTSNRGIISEALKLLDTPQVAQSVKAGFLKWVLRVESDGHPRVPLFNNSVVELPLDDIGVSLDVSVSFDSVDDANNDNCPRLCILPFLLLFLSLPSLPSLLLSSLLPRMAFSSTLKPLPLFLSLLLSFTRTL